MRYMNKEELEQAFFNFVLAAVLGEGGDGCALIICPRTPYQDIAQRFWSFLQNEPFPNRYKYFNKDNHVLISDCSNENFEFCGPRKLEESDLIFNELIVIYP